MTTNDADVLEFQLIVTARYAPEGTAKEAIAATLAAAGRHLVDNGLLSGELPAELLAVATVVRQTKERL